ncbi:MAG TPA: rhodanese-like domain-containing protein, partial [Chitinophagaceae bacterium]
MKHILFFLLSFVVIAVSANGSRHKGGNEPWTEDQLLAPADLAKIISDPHAKQPVIFSVGPGAVIKGSIDIGPARDKENLDKLKKQLLALPKDADIIIYCGCCPFEHCPNVRPAFSLLNEMQFTHHKLLNLEHNIKIDWIS